MESIRPIIRGDLPPVGNSIRLGPKDCCNLSLSGFHSTWVNSGTSALALALLSARAQKPNITKPEVIIPAYGCPDLVSACVYAGCIAKLTDISEEGWGFDLTLLDQAISDQTIAVIGVNFLGIREDWQGIKLIIDRHDESILCIEDNAQWFPDIDEDNSFPTDFVIFSFGKGKPISLLGGGVLFSKSHIENAPFPVELAITKQLALFGKYFLFNQILNPSIYWFVNHNPIFTPSQTTFKTLHRIIGMDTLRIKLFNANHSAFKQQQDTASRFYGELLTQLEFNNRIFPPNSDRIKKLLRYPLLCADRTIRDSLLTELNTHGLGATAMYQRALVDIIGPNASINSKLPQTRARHMADCLVTLPCHQGVTTKHLEKIKYLLSNSILLNQK